MRNKGKKILSFVAAATFLGAAFAFSGCGAEVYKGETLTDYVSSENAAVSNGGFVVEKDGFVYFINGMEDYTVSNEFGEVVKGALMRIAKTDLESGNYANVKTVVPMLFVAQNFDAGIYIYGDYVYYATPTTDKNMSGEVENSWIDFKRAKLDGSETMKNYYFRLSSNSSKYRFVEEGGVVYCLYEEDSKLKSFNTETNVSTVLVSGAKSSFFYDTKDATNPNVYYTMSVVYDADSDNSTTASYDQLYCVNAAATATVDASKASYTVAGGRTYDFDEEYLKKQNEEAKKNNEDEPYNLKDYSTYPYVNLGELVLDGIGANAANAGNWTQFNDDKTSTPATPDGYNYTITSYQNDGVYFTRAEVVKTSSDAESTKLYYLADADAKTINSVEGNTGDKLTVVAQNTTNASSSAIFYIENGVHNYIYLSSNTLYKANNVDGEKTAIAMAYNLSSATLWTIEGDYLYYYGSGTNGNNVSRINYKGGEDEYHAILVTDEYKPLTVAYIDWNSGWYKPEFVGDVLLYSNAQSFGTTSYNYIYAAKLGTTEEIKANNEAYDAVQDYIDEYSSNSALQAAMKYYFRTGKTEAFEAVKDLYSDYQIEEFEKFVADTELKEESAFIGQVGLVKEDDAEAIEEAWASTLLTEEKEEEDETLPVWAIVLIAVGGAVIVAAIVVLILLLVNKNKKEQEEAARAEETVNAYKRKKIDTTDDKTIDVYADEEQTTEVAVEETTEAAAEEPVAEEVEAPAEETVAETTEETVEENKED